MPDGDCQPLDSRFSLYARPRTGRHPAQAVCPAARPAIKNRGFRPAAPPPTVAAAIALLLALVAAAGCKPASNAGPRFLRQVEWIGRGVWLKADTHVHTQFSDGAHTVAEVSAKAREYGCDVLAITDHGDRELGAGTHEYVEAIDAARRQFPELTILAGLEWNVPPWGGDEHAVVLLPPGDREGQCLAEFKARFDDLGREEHDPALTDEGLEWLASLANNGVGPLAIYEHPGRKRKRAAQVLGDLRRWRAVSDVMIGFSGAPGHQAMQPLGAYRGALQPIDRWDPAAAGVGDAWDRLLQQGVDVWAAYAPSDFHDDRGDRQEGGLGDYWPGEFSETWLYAPEPSAEGVLRALRAGTFFGVHGRIAREVELRVDAAGLPRAAFAGEVIEAPPGAELTVELSMHTADVDWSGRPNRIDQIELISVTPQGAEILATCPPAAEGSTSLKTLATPAGGIVLRARGRRIVEDGPDLLFYTNPIRVTSLGGAAAPDDLPSARIANRSLMQLLIRPDALINVGGLAIVVSVLLLLLGGMRRPTATNSGASGPNHSGAPTDARPPIAAPRRIHYFFAWLSFAAFAVYGSWVPLNFRPLPWAEAVARFRAIPFLHLSIGSRADWVANILLFVPIGFCGLAACVCDRRSRLLKSAAALAVMGFCAALSVSVEFSQLWFPGRTVSQNDIVAETIGGAAGVALWLLLGERLTGWIRSFAVRSASRRQFDWLLQAYLLGLVLYSLFPLDLTISPAELWHKYREGKFRLVPFADVQFTVEGCFALASNVLLFVPVGMLAATAFRGPGQRSRPLLGSLLAGLAVAGGIELAQTFVYSRYVDATELITAAVGIAAGAAWRRSQLARPNDASLCPTRRRGLASLHLLAFVAYAAFLAAFFLLPFDFMEDEGRIQRRWQNFFGVPLTSLYWSTEYNALTQVLRKGLLFAPLGYLGVRMTALAQLRGWSRLAGLAASLGAAFVLALGIEFAQIWRDDTTANFTDVVLCTFGAVAALALTLRMENLSQFPVASSASAAEAAAMARGPVRLPWASAGWLLLAVGMLLVGAGLIAAWGGAAWKGVIPPCDPAQAAMPAARCVRSRSARPDPMSRGIFSATLEATFTSRACGMRTKSAATWQGAFPLDAILGEFPAASPAFLHGFLVARAATCLRGDLPSGGV